MNKLWLTLIPLTLLADTKPAVPPAGVVERQIEQEYDVKEVEAQKAVPLLEIDIPEKEIDMGDAKVRIDAVEISGNTVLSTRRLQRVVEPFLGQELSMKEIRAICVAIQARYASKGYFLARAYVPPQEIDNHTLKIQIIEGKLGKVSVIGNKYYGEKFVGRYFDKYLGRPINYDQILKALLLLDENSDLEVGAVFKKGETFGTADLIVRVSDKRPLHLMVDHNNYGSDHTAKQRTGAHFEWGNLLLDGDMLTIIEVVGSPIPSLDFTQGIYHFPINTYGSSFDLSYLYARFKTDKIDHVKYTGKSVVAEVKFTQAIHRTRLLNTDFFTSFDYKQIQNISQNSSTYDKLRVLTGGMAIDYIDGWKGRNLFNVSAGWGIPDIMGGSSVNSHDSSREGAGGRFVKLNGSWKRLQKIPYNCFLLLNLSMQYSFDKLPLPEQIYIGGVDTVRGYPLASGIGDSGFYANIELRVPPPFLRAHKVPWIKKTWGEFLQFVGFLDHGQTFDHGQDILRTLMTPASTTNFKRANLTSAGCGARIYGPWKLEWSFDVGWPLTDQHRSSNTIVYFRVAWNIL